jgi:hypothetical protein
MPNSNFVLHICGPNIKLRIEDSGVAYIHGVPNELVVVHIIFPFFT